MIRKIEYWMHWFNRNFMPILWIRHKIKLYNGVRVRMTSRQSGLGGSMSKIIYSDGSTIELHDKFLPPWVKKQKGSQQSE